MKRFIIITVTTMLAMLICSCSNGNSKQVQTEYMYTDNRFSYELENTASFAVNDDILYAAFYDLPYVYSYSPTGEKDAELYVGEGFHSNLCFSDDMLYMFTLSPDDSGITTVDIHSGENTFTHVNIPIPITMVAADEHIYLIYRDENIDPYLESIKYSENDNYAYFGEKAICINKNTAEITDIPINNVAGLKKCDENKLIYYAYDDVGGYYFTYYDTSSKEFSEKKYNNTIQNTFSFDYIPENKSIIYSDFSNRKLISVPMTENGVQIDFMCGAAAVNGNDMQYHNGNVYILDNSSGDVFRTDYKNAVKDNREIKILSPEIYTEVPYGCGYRINSQMLSDDEFALSILAGNTDFDVCMMTSAQTFSLNIRDKGAFYPLNDVPGVEEYLDKCFPYIGDAAKKSDGKIWMLPIAVDIPCIIYSSESCEKNGISFDKSITWEYLFDTAGRIYLSENLRSKYMLNEFQAASDIINRYNSNYAFSGNKSDYNNELFRNTCTMLRDISVSSESLHTWTESYSQYPDLQTYYSEYLFELKPDKFTLFEEYPFEMLRAVPTPSLDGKEKSCAECTYFCVNANSDNLPSALDFISTYCSYMASKNDTFMLSDESIYPFYGTQLSHDLYIIYSDAQVVFSLPKEIFFYDYFRFRSGEIDTDEFICEIERKADMYMNE